MELSISHVEVSSTSEAMRQLSPWFSVYNTPAEPFTHWLGSSPRLTTGHVFPGSLQ